MPVANEAILIKSANGIKPKMALNKSAVYVAAAALGAALLSAILLSSGSRVQRVKDDRTHKAQPLGRLSSLPSTYADIPPPEPTKRALRVSVSPRELSELEKLHAQIKAERLKKAIAARQSKVTFSNVESAAGEVDKAVTTGKGSGNGNASSSNRGEDSPGTTSENTTTTGGSSHTELSKRDEDNRQDDKFNFSQTSKTQDTTLHEKIKPLISKNALLAGSLIPGLLLTEVNSDLPGEIIGQVSQTVYDTVSGQHTLIPQGTKVLGRYDSRVTFGQERLLIVWHRLIFPSGESISLDGMQGTDQIGAAGVKDQVNNHYGRLLSGVILSSILGATAQMSQGNSVNTFNPSFDQLAAQGAAQNINNVGQRITERNLNIQPTLVIRPGSRFLIVVNKDMDLSGSL